MTDNRDRAMDAMPDITKVKIKTRRKPTRIYHTQKGVVEIVKEWNWAPRSYVWFVQPYGDECPKIPLGKFSSFTEARQFVASVLGTIPTYR